MQPSSSKNKLSTNKRGKFGQYHSPVLRSLAKLSNDTSQVQHCSSDTLTFASIVPARSTIVGPIVGYVARYSAIGNVELRYHRKRVIGGPVFLMEKLPELQDCIYWKLGIGDHSNPCRQILGSVILHILTDRNKRITVRHIVIDGSSHLVLGRNITRLCNIVHLWNRGLQIPLGDAAFLWMFDYDQNSHVASDRFVPPLSSPQPQCAKLTNMMSLQSAGASNIAQETFLVVTFDCHVLKRSRHGQRSRKLSTVFTKMCVVMPDMLISVRYCYEMLCGRTKFRISLSMLSLPVKAAEHHRLHLRIGVCRLHR